MSSRWPDKLIIGLTGNIATGKSVVMRFAAEQGALTIDADKLVHRVLDTDPLVQRRIESAFDGDLRHPDGSINRRSLGAIVFKNPFALERLEQIVHPAVRKLLLTEIDTASEQFVMIEAIKLLESGMAADCDVIWVTRCSEETQMQRLMVCRGMDRDTARMRIKAQPSQEKKVAVADVVIETDGTMVETERYFKHAWKRAAKSVPPADLPGTAPLNRNYHENLVPDIEERRKARSEQVIVRRAKPSDIPSLLWLIQQATSGTLKITRGQLLAALGNRGYLIGQQGTQISAVVGWHADNQVATIEEFYISPPEAAEMTGAALLEEVESTARSLICEVILALPPRFSAKKISELLLEHGYDVAEKEELPKTWKAAVNSYGLDGKSVLMKVLRDTRVTAK